MLPMLPTLGPLPPGPGWAFEFAWDGVRTLAVVEPDGLRLTSATGRDIPGSFPELAGLAAVGSAHRLVLDGELVALDDSGRLDAVRLRRRLGGHRPDALASRVPLAYVLLDLLRLDGRSTVPLPYRHRRELLAALDLGGGAVVLPPSFPDIDGQAVLDTAAGYGLSGVTAKRLDATYRPGRRSPGWVRTVLRQRQQVVLGGWIPGERVALGSLLVGVPDRHGLRYAGAVGTGLTGGDRRDLPRRFADIAGSDPPFLDRLPARLARSARWLAPELVGEVEHRRWSEAGRLVHPTWRGVCPAADPAQIRVAAALPAPAAPPGGSPPERAEVQHFLYNSLTMIAAYVRTDPVRARELLVDVADYTRYGLRRGDEPTTLGQELQQVARYGAVQQARFSDRLRVRLDVTPDLASTAVEPGIVQPLVERAVQRVEAVPGGGTVTVRALQEEAGCTVTVSDDVGGTGEYVRLGWRRR